MENIQITEETPISIIVENAKKEIGETINKLNLSPTILEWIIKDIYQEVQQAHLLEYKRDMEQLKETKK